MRKRYADTGTGSNQTIKRSRKKHSRDDGGQLCTGDQGKQGFESDHSDNAGVLHDPEACAGNRDFLSSSKNQSE